MTAEFGKVNRVFKLRRSLLFMLGSKINKACFNKLWQLH